jgi:hypothetical protein
MKIPTRQPRLRSLLPLLVGTALAAPMPLLAQSSFPDVPASSTTNAQDRQQMMWQLGVTAPVLPSKLVDPNRPPSAFPKSAANPEGDWQNFYGHTITRSAWGLWNNYEDTIDGFLDKDGFNGWNKFTVNDPDSWRVFDDAGSDYAKGGYTPIDLLKMNDGTPVTTQEQWWTQRRPEIFKDVQEELYGKIPDRSLWPAITWTLGSVTTGTANGVEYRQRVITGTIDISSYPAIRNRPSISATLRVPKAAFDAGKQVPVIITFGGSKWSNVAANGWGTINFNQGTVQGGGGANMSSWIIGLINKGAWRKPDDWGTLAAWSWGVSRLIDRLEVPTPANPAEITQANEFLGVNPKKLGIEGHSFLGKATLVTMAYEPRILIAYPSRGGSGGPKMNRRHWGQDLENSLGSDSEYYWYAGNAYKYVGPLRGTGSGTVGDPFGEIPASGPYVGNNQATWRALYPNAGANTTPGTYLPRKLELMTIDAHSMVALAAPRPVFTNGGTHDSWTDMRGMWLTQVYATPVYNLLGRKGLVDRTWPFASNPPHVPESPVTRHTPVIRNFDGYTEGHLGYRYAGEALHPEVPGEAASSGGHTDADDFPTFVKFAAKFFDDVTPPSLGLPLDQTVSPTSAAGAVVNFEALAVDEVDDQVPVKLSQASGSVFPIGTTLVTATATDVSSNTATESFTVTVEGITRGGFSLNRATRSVVQPVTLKNLSPETIAAPVCLVLDDLSSNTVLTNRSGITENGHPYLVLSSAPLAPGASVTAALQFANPDSGGVTYYPHIQGGANP